MILVTGASGFIGRSLMTVLQNQERPVKAYTGRINDPLGMRAELLDVETIIHLAGAEGRGRIRLLRHVDLDGTERLIEESQRAQVKHIIYVSRLNADRASSYPLLRIKGQVERLLQQSGLSYTIIRSANLYGRDDHFFNVITSLAAWTWPLVWLPGGGGLTGDRADDGSGGRRNDLRRRPGPHRAAPGCRGRGCDRAQL